MRPRWAHRVGMLAGVAFWALVAGEAGAQVPTRPEAGARFTDVQRRPTRMSPRSGPPGTRVTLRAADLPAFTPVHVAIGGTGSGFEALAFALTDRHGELVETIEVPSWAAQGNAHRLIVFDAYFAPLSVTDLFHVTGPDGTITREGEITNAGPTCAVMSVREGEAYTFVGDTEGLETGARVVVEGTIAWSAACGEGIPIRVVRLRRPARSP